MRGIIRPVSITDASALCSFADRTIGRGYYTEDELKDKILQSSHLTKTCSFVLENLDSGELCGFRMTFPPGNWHKGKGTGLYPEKWNVDIKDTAYFQSLFIAPEVTHQGWGTKLSMASIEVLREIGARAVVTHSWVQSPNQSSLKYLSALGFKSVGFHSNYWFDVDYTCTLCGKPCVCTAEEMILYLDKE